MRTTGKSPDYGRGAGVGRDRGSGRKFLKAQLRHYLDKIRVPREQRFYAEESVGL